MSAINVSLQKYRYIYRWGMPGMCRGDKVRARMELVPADDLLLCFLTRRHSTIFSRQRIDDRINESMSIKRSSAENFAF